MENSSFYNAFERMWQHILSKCNNYVSNEVLDNHTSNMDNPHNVTKEQIGVENVDNTADLDKPISYATQAVLDAKAALEHEHDANNITSGVLGVEHGGTGYDSIVDAEYYIPRYRASALVSTEAIPIDNGIINWVYE